VTRASRVELPGTAVALAFAVATLGFHALLHESSYTSFHRALPGLDSQPRSRGAELTITIALTGVAIFGSLATQAVEAVVHEVAGHPRQRSERAA
jgi:hypothetical protein